MYILFNNIEDFNSWHSEIKTLLGIPSEDGSTTDVKVLKNTTPMSNEMLADRIGLLPIIMPEGFETWNKESILFKLHVTNTSEEPRFVTASDFECIKKKEDGEERIPNTEFFHPNLMTGSTSLIAMLPGQLPGQKPEEIHIEAYASMGKGREHARFNPTCQCSYGYTLDPNPQRVYELWIRWLSEQKKISEADLEKDQAKKEALNREFRSLQIFRCYKVGAVDNEPNSFDFTVESVGPMPISQILVKGLQALSQLCMNYASVDRGDLPDSITIQPTQMKMIGFDVLFQNEDHTLGNILQTWLDDNKIGRVGEGEASLSFIGTSVPHPLRPELKMTFGFADPNAATRENVRLLIAQAAKACADMFTEWMIDLETQLTNKNIQTPKTPEGPEVLTGPWDALAAGRGTTAAAPPRGTAAPRGTRGRGRGTARGR
jgi:DNA-directed RNA polymerase II subunit RPB3